MTQNYKTDTINVTASVTAKDWNDVPDTVSINIDGVTHTLQKIKAPDAATRSN